MSLKIRLDRPEALIYEFNLQLFMFYLIFFFNKLKKLFTYVNPFYPLRNRR